MADAIRLMDQKSAARRLGVTIATLRAACADGTLKYALVGKRRKFTEADLLAYVEAVKCPSIDVPARRTGGTTSRSRVVGFEAALAQRPATPRR